MPIEQDPIVSDAMKKFFELFDPTIQLAEGLIGTKTNAQEVLLLLCARLDALASSISHEEQSNRDAFTRLVIGYGGYRDLMESISAGDLYYELGYHRWLAEGMIPKPGRLVRFSSINDPIIELLDQSDIPLTIEAVQSLLTRLMRAISGNFRCRPGQPLKKPTTGKKEEMKNAISNEFKHAKDIDLSRLLAGIQSLLSSKTLSSVLYEKFRNAAVHGIKVDIDKGVFFSAKQPYWESLYSEHYPPFMFVKFPAPFLLELLRNSMHTLKSAVTATGKIPPDIHFEVFGSGLDRTHLLDLELLPKSRNLGLQRIKR